MLNRKNRWKNPNILEILGDGTQNKSYLHINGCIEALLLGIEKPKEQVEIYNAGSEDQINVKTIAEIAADKMGFNTSSSTSQAE